jgi:hypothetical protein
MGANKSLSVPPGTLISTAPWVGEVSPGYLRHIQQFPFHHPLRVDLPTRISLAEWIWMLRLGKGESCSSGMGSLVVNRWS